MRRPGKRQPEIRWTKLEEIKGLGIRASDAQGNEYKAGSLKFFTEENEMIREDLNRASDNGNGPSTPNSLEAKKGIDQQMKDAEHNIYVSKNGTLTGWVDMQDELRPEAVEVVRYFKDRNIRTILLSGDRWQKCRDIAELLGIDEVIAEQSPEQKLEQVARLSAIAPTAMVGDGINDAPALAKATLGISMSDASQLALQTADVVLMNSGLKKLPMSLQLGTLTFSTIRQNLFWAFFYNIIAIPVAAIGLLTPAIGALAMALSDVVLLINSSRLFVKKLE